MRFPITVTSTLDHLIEIAICEYNGGVLAAKLQ